MNQVAGIQDGGRDAQPEMILETVKIVKDAVEKGVLVNLIANNIIPRVDKFPTIFL